MQPNMLEEVFLQELGYANSDGFETDVTWHNRRSIPSIHAAYNVRNTRIAYFSRFEYLDRDELWELHRAIWSESRAPLLYVILPEEIRVYNCYAVPSDSSDELDSETRLLRHLKHLTDAETARQEVREQLVELGFYDRLHLDTGVFWTTVDGQRVKRKDRADQRLLTEMDYLRRDLLAKELSNDVAYALLGRSILIRYLEDRGMLTEDDISRLTDGKASTYRNILNDKQQTYAFYRRLSARFDSDLFPVDDEEVQSVQEIHLDRLRMFLDGTLHSGQLAFWHYNFKYIPIELISGIYDTFLNTKEKKKAGTYYTPLALADFILEETLPTESTKPDTAILDPACGSGVFLVGAYRRLIHAWETEKQDKVTFDVLSNLLKKNIFGVDIDKSAIRIAAFNLYLVMLDYLTNEQIKTDFSFPHLVGTNLLVGDFFSDTTKEKLGRYDRIIGNPPWGKGTLTPDAETWVNGHQETIGEKNIVQAFLLHAPEFCKEDAEVAFLAPAKSTIFVTSSRHREFSKGFFGRYRTRAVFNFSALVYELFPDAKHPAIAIFYSPTAPEQDAKILYATPKPSALSQQLSAVVLDSTEVKFLELDELLTHSELWKVALWGTHRDAALIKKLSSYPSLREQADELGWEVGTGYQIQGPGKRISAAWLEDMLTVPVDSLFQRYRLSADTLQPVGVRSFRRVSERMRNVLFVPPLALIHKSPMNGRCAAAFAPEAIAFNDSICGVSGNADQEKYLKWLVAYINSPLAQYYHFLTSTRWAVERGAMIQSEYESMPFILPDEDDPVLSKVLKHFSEIEKALQADSLLVKDKSRTKVQEHELAIQELVFDIYELSPADRQLVLDMTRYGIEYFYWSKQTTRKPLGAESISPPNIDMLNRYAETFIETSKALLRYQGQTLRAIIYDNGRTPLRVVGFELIDLTDDPKIRIEDSPAELQEQLRYLDKLLLEQHHSSLYMRRHVRIYDGTSLYLVRPSEKRFWTQSQARADADDAIVDWLSQPSGLEVEG